MSVAQQFALLCVFNSVACVFAQKEFNDVNTLPTFASFMEKHQRTYAAGTKEYDMRRGIFEQRLKQVQEHNSRPHRLWDAAVNHLSDRTEEEFAQLRGLRLMQASKMGSRSTRAVGPHKMFLSQMKKAVVATNRSWDHLNAVKQDIDQSACGSCWAIATSMMLQANAEINGYDRTFSTQELVSCTPNPHNCGGSGGCDGATVELGMNYLMEYGLDTEQGTPYTAETGKCKKGGNINLIEKIDHYDSNLEAMIAVGFHGPKSKSSGGILLGLKGWERLPENEYEPLITAVAETGPVAVSVGANGWNSYGAGVFDGCDKDATIDHAVTLIGYGTDKERNQKYWQIKNSWGNSWGENGNIRLLRNEGNVHCGTDYQPKVGTGCDGGPSSVKVCGMCGILYDSVVPHFEKKM